MDLVVIENVVMLMSAIIGLLGGLFRYFERPRRGWLYVCFFFLSHILSDYYWTIYSLVMHTDPEVSELMAYFGWNVGYAILLLAALHMEDRNAKRYFNPLMLIPVPINAVQLFIYIKFGGIINNIWQVSFTTAVSCISMQAFLYFLKNRKKGAHFPYFHTLLLIFMISEYGMWTSSCFDWVSSYSNPYYLFELAACITMVFFGWGVGRDYRAEGLGTPDKTADEIKFQTLLQVVATFIILGGCAGGYFIALWMKNSIPDGVRSNEVYKIIAVTLFILSIFLIILILAVIFIIAYRFANMAQDRKGSEHIRRSRFNLFSTALITLGLMIFSVVYTSRLFQEVAINGVYSAGEDKAVTLASELENYLVVAKSTLQVTADTIDLMIRDGESQEKIGKYLTYQTDDQSDQFDENFTGIYAFVRGEYMDGSGWIPPDDYDATGRDWYNMSVKAGGKTMIIPPYVDAQTKSVVITICKLVSDDSQQSRYKGKNVVALDVIVNYIQEMTSQADVNGKGYGMIIDRDGLIVAHRDQETVGKNFAELFGQDTLDMLLMTRHDTISAKLDGEDNTLFVSQVMGQWYVVLAVSDTELFEETYSQLLVNILVSLIIFVLISFFYYLGYRNEQVYDRQMEEMRASKQEQEYAAQILRLEKASADEANKAKSSFLADMSHEIRTPINAILGMNEMVLREAKDSNILEYSRNIGVSGKNLLQLINSILDFSKIEDGKMEIVPVSYEVKDLLSYLLNSVSERARAKDLKLEFEVDPSIPSELYGDDTRISQVIMNLLTNAVKYTPEGKVTLSVKGKEKRDRNILLHVEVKDTGIGIKEEDMGRLFESFERLDLKKNRNIEGTGLGMAITTKLLRLMDSELKVESEYGKGSIFYFELWQEIENEEPVGDFRQAAVEAKDLYPDMDYFRAPSARILITDDTRMNITVVVSLLKRTGIQTDTAESGEQAIALADQNKYDVILLDQRMPVLDGTQTLKRIRESGNGKNKDTPVICLTADAIRGAKDRYMAEGFTDYLTKPVNGHDLEEMLKTYLPAGKIEAAAEEDETEETAAVSADPLYKALEEAGIITEKGLGLFDNNEETYKEILAEYVRDSRSRRSRLEEYYSEKDWDNYRISIHSLKSSSKTIGAMELSELALTLENASGDRDEGVIKEKHPAAVEMYDRIVSVIESSVDIDENTGYRENEDGTIEFD